MSTEIFPKTTTSQRSKKSKKTSNVIPEKIKKYVKSQISRETENKLRVYYASNAPLYNSTNNDFDEYNIFALSAALNIQQGVGDGQRVGNEITVKRHMVRGTLYLSPYNVTTNIQQVPLNVKMFVFYDKRNPTQYPTPQLSGNFFQFNSIAQWCNNDLTDMWQPVNTDIYKVFATRQFRIGLANNNQNTAGSQPAGPLNRANNDYNYTADFKIDVTKYMPKIVRYNDNTGTPTSRDLFFMFIMSAADGSALPIASIPARVSYVNTVEYEDA